MGKRQTEQPQVKAAKITRSGVIWAAVITVIGAVIIAIFQPFSYNHTKTSFEESVKSKERQTMQISDYNLKSLPSNEKIIPVSANVDRQILEGSITSLIQLIRSDPDDESVLQDWFERNPTIFMLLGYQAIIAKPILETSTGEKFIPDFMGLRLDENWEILELKTPKVRVLKDTTRRQSFYADFNSYIIQCRDYSQFFEDNAHRDWFQKEFGIPVQRYVKAKIIAGVDDSLERNKIYEKLFDQGGKVEHLSYTDILRQLDLHRDALFSGGEGKPGIGLHFAIVPLALKGKDNFIVDIGDDPKRNRVTIYIDQKGNLIFRIIDNESKTYSISIPYGAGGFQYGKLLALSFEVGKNVDYTFACTEINGKFFADRKFDPMDLNVNLSSIILGSDIYAKEHTHMKVAEWMVVVNSLPFDEKLKLRNWFYKQYFNPADKTIDEKAVVYFNGHKHMATDGHPANQKKPTS